MRQILPILIFVGVGLTVGGGLLGYRIYRHHRANARAEPVFLLTPDSRFYGPPPQSVSDFAAQQLPDGSIRVSWKGGQGCDAFLITRQLPQQPEPEKLADVPAGQTKYDLNLTLSPGTTWDFDLWIQGHNARFGYVAPQRVRPPPAPEGIAPPAAP